MNTLSKAVKSNRNLFFSGVMILTLANIIVKAIGLLYKIPLSDLLGEEGMGYFNAAYNIYVVFYMISTAGLPIAVSILVSASRAKGNMRETRYIYKIALILFLIIGAVGTSIMMLGARLLAGMIHMDGAYYCILGIAPTIFFICLASAIRGYYQGFQNMAPTSISQVLEALGKLLLGILFAVYAIEKGYSLPVVAAFSIAGLTVGVLAGMIYLFISKWFFCDEKNSAEFLHDDSFSMPVMGWKTITKQLIITAIPITISASMMSLANTVDLMIISGRLQAVGYTEELAAALYGNYTTFCVPLFNLPPVLIYPISYSIIPYISAAISSGDMAKAKTTINSALRIASILAIPSALGLSVLSEPIIRLLFRNHSDEVIGRAAPLLQILALSVFFLGMLSVTNAVLQANKCERYPIISMICGAGVKLLSSYCLIGIPGVEMYGAPIGTFFCYLTATLLNFIFLAKKVKLIPQIGKVFVRPLLASVICALSAIGFYKLADLVFGNTLSTLIAIAGAVLVYVVAIFLIKAIDQDDIAMLPKGDKLLRVLKKVKLIRA